MDNVSTAAPVVKMLIKRAIAVGKSRNLKYVRLGKKVPVLLEKEYEYLGNPDFNPGAGSQSGIGGVSGRVKSHGVRCPQNN